MSRSCGRCSRHSSAETSRHCSHSRTRMSRFAPRGTRFRPRSARVRRRSWPSGGIGPPSGTSIRSSRVPSHTVCMRQIRMTRLLIFAPRGDHEGMPLAASISTASLSWRHSCDPCITRGSLRRKYSIVFFSPRESPRWWKLYKGRAAVEREFGRLKNEWALLPLRVRGLDRVPASC
jgi:hypothetical protein